MVADALRRWTSIYVRRFQEILDLHEPALPVTARELGEMIVSVIEGGLVLQRAYGDATLTARQSQQFRNYLTLLFGGRPSEAGRTAQQPSKRRTAAKVHA
jgi:TetR/AcrR family transcriptional repressor of nem operon